MAATETQLLETHAIKSRALSGVKILALRTAATVGLRIVSSLCLAHLLFPRDYGLFAAAACLTGLGQFLSDVGLGGALIRQETTPTANETFTVFCAQQAMTAAIVTTLLLASPLLLPLYGLPHTAGPLLAVMALSLFFSSLRVVPMMTLERDLHYIPIARCELIESLVQTSGTLGLAALGCGVWALAGGGLLRGAVGLVCVWAASPWRPHGIFEFTTLRRLARFGLPFQLNALVPALLGNWMPLTVGRLLGVAAVGLVSWAANLASVPLMLSAVLNRVAFPALSRLQSDPEALAGFVCASIRRLCIVFALVVPVVVIACPLLIPVLFGRRWSEAIPLVQWFSVECALLTLTGVLASAQNALGRASERLGVTVLIGTLRWGGGFLVVKWFGLGGIGPLVVAVSLLELVLTVVLLRRQLPFDREQWRIGQKSDQSCPREGGDWAEGHSAKEFTPLPYSPLPYSPLPYSRPMTHDVTISLINHCNPALLSACLRSLFAGTHRCTLDVWVVDNATDGGGVPELQAEFPQVHWLFNTRRLGFSENHNQVLRQAVGRYACILNDDIIVHDGAFDRLVSYMDANPKIGMAGARLLNLDGSPQPCTFRFLTLWSELISICFLPRSLSHWKSFGIDPAYTHVEAAQVDWVLGACLIIRDTALKEIGLLDNTLSPIANTEEVDWCRRAYQCGWSVGYCPTAVLTHLGGQSLWSSGWSPGSGADPMRVEMHRTRLALFQKHDGPFHTRLLRLIYCLTLPWNIFMLTQSALRRTITGAECRRHRATLIEIARMSLRFRTVQ